MASPSFWELAQQALSSTRDGYNLIAPKFDGSVFRTPACVIDAMESHLRQRGPFSSALDVGCGTGALCELLLKIGATRIIGLDQSEGMLDVARRQCLPQPGQQVEFWHGSILELRAREEFDVATCFGMFGHIEAHHHPLMVRRIYQSLRRGGRFVTVLSHFPRKTRWIYWLAWLFDALMRLRNRFFSPPFVMYYLTFPLVRAQRLMEAEGFRVELVDDVFPEPFRQLKLVIATKPDGD